MHGNESFSSTGFVAIVLVFALKHSARNPCCIDLSLVESQCEEECAHRWFDAADSLRCHLSHVFTHDHQLKCHWITAHNRLQGSNSCYDLQHTETDVSVCCVSAAVSSNGKAKRERHLDARVSFSRRGSIQDSSVAHLKRLKFIIWSAGTHYSLRNALSTIPTREMHVV